MTNLERLHSQAKSAGAPVDMSNPAHPVEYDELRHGFQVMAELKAKYPGAEWSRHMGAGVASAKQYLATHACLDGWSLTATSGTESFQQARFKLYQRHKEEARELARQHDRKAHWLSQKDTNQCIREGLDDIAKGKAPSGTRYLRNRSKGDEYVAKVRSLRNDSQNAKALRNLSGHDVMRTINESALEVSAMHRGTLSGCLKNVAAHYINAGKLAEQVRREVAKATAGIRAEQAAHTKRLEVVESGEHWHDIAKRMRSQGAGPTAIAHATGQKLNTVKVYLKRQPRA
ncbi:hypothetical protein ACNFH8_08215 [Pseudomonas sp. NY15436]|uniref:hypothetical protein n=1 Tax=Pseudomonas sp. NY15436 TaxID=3400359 RepID=UPI003A8479B5